MKVKSKSIIALAVTVMMLAGACGSRVSSDAKKSDGGMTSKTDNGSKGGPSGQVDKFGTMDSPCGPGDASGATDKGVTNDEITVTSVADPGGFIPGLNIGIHHSMKAFEKWCNDQGGINGRKIKVILADAKLFEYKAVVSQACEDSFALVGGLGVMDSQGAQTQVDCDLINVPAAAVNPEQTMADLTYEPLPNPTTTYPVGSAIWLKSQYPDAITSGALLRTGIATTINQSDRLKEGYEQIGYEFPYVKNTNQPETNWAPLVLDMKNKGIEFLNLTATQEEMVPLQKEMAKQGFKPDIVELESNFYDTEYPAKVGADGNGTYVRITIWPFEEASENPATQQFIDALAASDPNAAPTLLGVQAWSAALLWAQAVKALGSNVTRVGVSEQIGQVHDWTGGGLHQPTNPGSRERGSCVIMMEVEDGKFVRAYPLKDKDADVYTQGNGYACLPNSVVPLPSGDPSRGAHK